MKTISILALTGLALFLGACGEDSPAVNKVAIERSVKDVEKSMLKAFTSKDAGAFAAFYTADAVFMTPSMAAVKGPAAIRGAMTAIMADPNLKGDWASDRTEVADSGDMVATRGTFTMTMTNPATKKPFTDKGSYVTVFRKQKDAAWKAVLDINTSEVPPPAPVMKANAVNKKAKKGKKR